MLDVMTRVAPDAASKISMPLVMLFSATVMRELRAHTALASGLLQGCTAWHTHRQAACAEHGASRSAT